MNELRAMPVKNPFFVLGQWQIMSESTTRLYPWQETLMLLMLSFML